MGLQISTRNASSCLLLGHHSGLLPPNNNLHKSRLPLPSLSRHGKAFHGRGDHTSEQEAKQSFDANTSSGRLSDGIIQHLLNLYGSTATARDFEIYAQNATFEDPLMCAHGVKQIKSAFYSLPKVFSESRIVEYTLREDIRAPGSGEILIDNKQYYKVFGKDVDVISLIRLNVEGGKIVHHEDWWDKKPLRNRETVQLPLVGRLAELSRRGSMLVTHALMGFGKDPTP